MEKESREALECHLAELRDDGSVISEGAFTLTPEKALDKLAAFSLPGPGLWAVKVVQASVASGAYSSIRVEQTRTLNRIHFRLGGSWTLEQIEARFFQTASRGQRVLDHLVMGLWAVGLGPRGREFRIERPEQTEGLLWTTEGFRRYPVAQPPEEWTLTVPHARPGESGLSNWTTNLTLAPLRNAEVSRALADRAYVCPMPLTVDGRRVDALQLSPEQGYSAHCFPLLLGFETTEMPRFHPPRGTFEALPSDRARKGREKGWISDEVLQGPENPGPVSVAVLASYHIVPRLSTVTPRETSSCLCWITDGVVVGVEPSPEQSTGFGAAIFLSADGLPTDLTSLALRQGDLRDARRSQAIDLACQILNRASRVKFTAGKQATVQSKTIGWLGLAFGLYSGSLFLVGAWAWSRLKRSVPPLEVERLRTGLEEFAQGFPQLWGR